MDKKLYRPLLICILVITVGLILTGFYVFGVKAGAKSPQSWFWRVDDPPGPQTALIGEQPDGGFGSAIAIGDVNGDSFSDLVIGARYTDHGLRGEGEVYILPGPLPFGQTIPMPQRTALRLFGRKPESYLGALLDTGDLNGDGFADIIAGAYHDGENFVVLGSPGITVTAPMSRTLTPDSAAMTVVGPNQGFIACNLNHDQYDDLVLEYLHFDYQSGLTYRLYGILGSPDLSNTQPITVDVQSDPVNLVVTGFNLGGWSGLGEENLGCGDVDGDGFQDLVIGAYGENVGEGITAGAVYVIRGSSEFTYTRQITVQIPDQADVIIGGIDGGRGEFGDMLGESLAVADVNADGRDDLILGAPNGDGPYNNSASIGEAYLWLGRTLNGQTVDLSREAEWILHGDTYASFFGSAISAGDLDRDGRAEVFFGCDRCNKNYAIYSYGSGYIVDPERFHGEHMIKEVATTTIVNTLAHSTFGFTPGIIDIDGDREMDILIGSVIQDHPITLYLLDYPDLSFLYFPILLR